MFGCGEDGREKRAGHGAPWAGPWLMEEYFGRNWDGRMGPGYYRFEGGTGLE